MEFTIDEWIEKIVLKNIKTSSVAKSYIYSLFKNMINVKNDISDQSLVLLYNTASIKNNFEDYQTIGDFVLWSASYCPESIVEYELSLDIGKLCYYSCYNILKRKWGLYNEIADNMEEITKTINSNIKKNQ
jgi:hypothetical protein